jgi:hypothetical protein
MGDAFPFFYGRQQLPDNKMANDDRLANNSRVLIILNASMKRHTIKRPLFHASFMVAPASRWLRIE